MATDKSVLAVIRAARPTFRNQNDKIAFVVHSSFLASGYILTATGPLALSDTALSNSSNGNPKKILFFFFFNFSMIFSMGFSVFIYVLRFVNV